jgi:FKBP-type peptidyl-prolyl cis-trans isomerase SlpA
MTPALMTPAPLVRPDSFLTLHYRLAGPDGVEFVSTYAGPPATLSLGQGQLAPAIETRLLGLAEGAHASFELPAGSAFGLRNPALVQRVARAWLDRHGDADAAYAPGDVVRFPGPAGAGSCAGTVQAVGEGWVEFDFNHPLAGRPLTFEVDVLGVL